MANNVYHDPTVSQCHSFNRNFLIQLIILKSFNSMLNMSSTLNNVVEYCNPNGLRLMAAMLTLHIQLLIYCVIDFTRFVYKPKMNVHQNKTPEINRILGSKMYTTSLGYPNTKISLLPTDGWMDGWMTCDFISFSTVLQSYQGDGRLIMNGCVKRNSIAVEKISPRAGIELGPLDQKASA